MAQKYPSICEHCLFGRQCNNIASYNRRVVPSHLLPPPSQGQDAFEIALERAAASLRTDSRLLLELRPLARSLRLASTHWLQARLYELLAAYYGNAAHHDRAATCLREVRALPARLPYTTIE